MRSVALVVALIGVIQGCSSGDHFQAGKDSVKFSVAISADERRGEAPSVAPAEVKKQCWNLLEKLRRDGVGLKPQTEHRIESYFTVADAFEADGLLVHAVDYLMDLEHKLQQLVDARAGKKVPESLIETEDDILHFRDAHNIHVFDNKYMAGAQPTEEGYRWLKSKGVTTIINLRLPTDHEKTLLEELGMEYVHIPWADERAPSVEQVNRMLAAVRNAKGKVMQHCLRGIGRDMTMASCYMIANHGASAEKLIEQGGKLAPRWEADQKRDAQSGEPVQFKLLREFETLWNAQGE